MIYIIYRTILHDACLSGNENLVEMLINTNKFDLTDVDILFYIFMKF